MIVDISTTATPIKIAGDVYSYQIPVFIRKNLSCLMKYLGLSGGATIILSEILLLIYFRVLVDRQSYNTPHSKIVADISVLCFDRQKHNYTR
ncbi:MAG: hypothetical protein IJU26_07440 [Synergistaceae bacterium]|nr:hypothetical protein [Synergistaceae bacterium]